MSKLHFFDRNQDYAVLERRLPLWVQPGVVSLINFHTNDSIPKSVLAIWRADRADWLRQRAINPFASDWRQQLAALECSEQEDFYRRFSAKWHSELDACHGACVLRQPRLAAIVGQSLRHADGDRYFLADVIVMPNHVHILCTFSDEKGVLSQCESWKRFTARKLNLALGESGRFWRQDGFNHLIRSEDQFRHFQKYIRQNAQKAGLKTGQSLHYSAGV